LEATFTAELLKQGILGIIILVEAYVIATLYRKLEKRDADLLELSKAQSASNERVAAALQESTIALKESAEINAQTRDYLERRRRS
jgi:predicted Holliday junction resolvase-like endonuclease